MQSCVEAKTRGTIKTGGRREDGLGEGRRGCREMDDHDGAGSVYQASRVGQLSLHWTRSGRRGHLEERWRVPARETLLDTQGKE